VPLIIRWTRKYKVLKIIGENRSWHLCLRCWLDESSKWSATTFRKK
jgi:hypothetical protein